MKIVIAPDSFKESMSALEVASAIERGIRNVSSSWDIVKIPLADGGEGTVEALTYSLGGKTITHTVTGPLGERIDAKYGIIHDQTAVIEVASAVGLHLIPQQKRNPMNTTTYGVGELITHALDQGVRTFIIGLGGSGTNDGGIGMAQALGAEITDKHGNPVSFGGKGLGQVVHISRKQMDKRLRECTFQVASDVKNPLVGPHGATYVYGRQKGADANLLPMLEQYMKNYANLLQRDLHVKVTEVEGAGAAGGLGAAFFAFLNAKLERGIDIITKQTNIEAHIKDADIVITGEGKMDDQTMYGKTPIGVATIAKKYRVPVIVITGSNQVTSSNIYDAGISAIFSIINEPISLHEAMNNGKALTETLAENMFRLLVKYR